MAAMQFWGVEVKAKEPNKVTLDEGHVIHLSQATLGELKKDNEPVMIHVKVGDKKFVLGILNQSTPQLSFDLVFDQEFEISHNLKKGSVHFLGYTTELPEEHDDVFGDYSEDEEDVIPTLQNGKPAAPAQVEAAKPVVAKPESSKANKPKPQEKDDSDEDDSDDQDDSDEDDNSDEDINMTNKSDDESDDDEDDDSDDDDDEDEKPPKPEFGKKRANADAKTPESKKAKVVTPQKTDGKKHVHIATPHPSKKGAKTPGSDKSTPKSGGQFGCEPCKKTFNSENALQSHNKAKHAGK